MVTCNRTLEYHRDSGRESGGYYAARSDPPDDARSPSATVQQLLHAPVTPADRFQIPGRLFPDDPPSSPPASSLGTLSAGRAVASGRFRVRQGIGRSPTNFQD